MRQVLQAKVEIILLIRGIEFDGALIILYRLEVLTGFLLKAGKQVVECGGRATFERAS